MSAAALAWFVVRVIPKPIRATYPCQRAAFPLATAFVIWLLAVKTSLLVWLNSRTWLRRLRPVLLTGLLVCLSVLAATSTTQALLHFGSLPKPSPKAWTPADPPNTPLGIGKGIFPGRVVWMRDTNATPWGGIYGHWWYNETGVKQAAVERMMSCSLQALAGAASDAAAWDKVFRFYNTTHGRGDFGYQTNESIVLKINCNNCYAGNEDDDDQIDSAPQSVLAILRQLVNRAGVPQGQITVYEAVRFVPNRILDNCRTEFPNVRWLDSQGGNGVCQKVTWHANAFTYSTNLAKLENKVPEAVYQATYLINMALLKGHWHAGVSLTAKNHLGTISGAPFDHTYIAAHKLPMGVYHPFVDFIGTRQLGGKTLLYMIEGLYGVLEVESFVGSSTANWANLFGGGWSSSFFTSFDPVAIDSVGLDFLRSEFGAQLANNHSTNCDNFLHEAALADNPPSGIAYQPDGSRLASLGVHEHWNNSTAMQYSGNLGASNGIELVKIVASTKPAVALVNPRNGSSLTEGTALALLAVVADGQYPTRQVDFYRGSTLLGTVTNAPFSLSWSDAPPGVWALRAVATDTHSLSSTSAVVSLTIAASTNIAPPAISSIALSNDTVVLTFLTVSGHTYRVDATEMVKPPVWVPLAPTQTASGASLTILDAIGTRTARFYRATLVQ